MKESQMHLINKMFDNETIRTVWNVVKHRFRKEGNESVTNCNQLKLKSSDDKYYNTDVVDIEGMFRII